MPHSKDQSGWSDRGYLPHLDQPNLIQSVTFRLADSMPQDRREEWEHLLLIANESERIRQLEMWLDKGAGDCVFRDPVCAQIVQDALRFFDGERYRLITWCVMPNHVHVMFETFGGHPLGGLIHSWKTFTAREINQHLARKGSLWQDDYFDRFIRDGNHLENEARYIEGNPFAARLVELAEDWPFSSATHQNSAALHHQNRRSASMAKPTRLFLGFQRGHNPDTKVASGLRHTRAPSCLEIVVTSSATASPARRSTETCGRVRESGRECPSGARV